MEQIKNSPFKLESFTVIESHITREPKKVGNVEVSINPKGVLNRSLKNFSLFLEVMLKDSSSFDINISCIGSFVFKKDISEQEMSNYFLINAPAIVFPYIRAYVSAVTALSGLPAVNIPVMNLSMMKEELKKNIVDVSERPKALNARKKAIK